MANNPDALTELSFRPFAALCPNILLYTPPSSSTPSPQHPRLIIMGTWQGGATSSRIAVYCRAYQSIYPSTPILLIRSGFADLTTKSFASVQKQLGPAQDYIFSLFPPPSMPSSPYVRSSKKIKPSDGALIHMFSHGGSNSLLQLSRLLRSTAANKENDQTTTFPIPLIGMVLDSTPGIGTFYKAYTAATYSLPQSQPLNLIGRAMLLPSIGTLVALQKVGLVSSVDDMRRELNDPHSFGPAPRLYLHSKGDPLVLPLEVALHAEEAERNGWRITREVWETAGHCALPMEDGVRYWKAIKGFVDDEGEARDVKL